MKRLLLPLFLLACHQNGDAKQESNVTNGTTDVNGNDADQDGYDAGAGGDCDDSNASVHPDATESCNEIDDNCDGTVDEGLGSTFYQDADGDTYGDPSAARTACEAPDRSVANAADCDDQDASVHPGATETCTDTTDKNCDGSIGYSDADGDGVPACEDCDDTNAAVSPKATEVCDAANIDENCNGLADDADSTVDPSSRSSTYADNDADGYGVGAPTLACDGKGAAADGDCDDSNYLFHPGAAEACTDASDYNCDGSIGYSDADGDGWAACTECDDSNAAVHPDATEECNGYDDNCDGAIDESGTGASTFYVDADGDGHGDSSDVGVYNCTAPTGYISSHDDCDDQAAATWPGAGEYCDGVDSDCDGVIDNNPLNPSTWYADIDNDGYGDATITAVDCRAPTGFGADSSDCNDADAAIHPLAAEFCNGVDDDCDGTVDNNAVDAGIWYTDADGDGYGDNGSATPACNQPNNSIPTGGDCNDTDSAYNPAALENDCADPNDYNCDGVTGYADTDGDGWPACQDCNDADATVSPGATEACDGVDNNCDGAVDESGALGEIIWYADKDQDGYGNTSAWRLACDAPAGYVSNASDCNDASGVAYPGGTEVCDGIDNDCDGTADNGAVGSVLWYADGDGDGYGDPAATAWGCSAPTGYVGNALDCAPVDWAIFPGATEVCDGQDNNCDGTVDSDAVDRITWYADADGDSYGNSSISLVDCNQPSGFVAAGGDCDDTSAGLNPGATETCNGIDDDCDAAIDEAGAVGSNTWYADADGDGYGDPATARSACSQPAGYILASGDCNDASALANPTANESCDGLDNDCDGQTDESGAVGESTWYQDADGDGYGNPAISARACSAPTGYVANAIDCDDTQKAAGPGTDTDLDGTYDCFDPDDDNDGLTDTDENNGTTSGFVTDPLIVDTDGDGYSDFVDPAPVTAACHTTLLAYDDFTSNPTATWTTVSGTWTWDSVDDWSNTSTTAGANVWLGARTWTDYVVEARMKVTTNSGDAGFMSRVGSVSAKNNGGKDYYVGLYPSSNQVTLGYQDGSWHALSSGTATVDPNVWYTLQLRQSGTAFTVYLDGTLVVSATNSKYSSGSIGLRTYNSPAMYDYILACN